MLLLSPQQPVAPHFSGRTLVLVALAHAGLMGFAASGRVEFPAQPAATLRVTALTPVEAPRRATPRPAAPAVSATPATRTTTPQPVAKPVDAPAPMAPGASTGISDTPVGKEAPAGPPATTLTAARFDVDYLRNPAPAYPPMSRRLGEEGKVVLRVLVEPAGTPGTIEIRESSGSVRLDQAAADAVRRWKFVPARRGEEAISTWVLVPVVFNLRG